LKLDGQQAQTLIDVIVQVPCNPGTLLLLRLNQPPAYAGKRLFRQFAFADVLDEGNDQRRSSIATLQK